MSELKPWPDYRSPEYGIAIADGLFTGNAEQVLAYERARAEAAMARLRVAVEALELLRGYSDRSGIKRADEALSDIGEIPRE
jgi:hypothetical protein